MQVAEPDTESSRPHRLFWWKEALIVTAFYLVYSTHAEPVRLQPHRGRRRARPRVQQRHASDRLGARHRHLPRGVDPGLVPAAPHVLAVLEHVLRRRPLRRHPRRVHRAVRPAPGGLPAAPQHARGHDRARDRRLRVLPVDAAATARRAVPGAGAAAARSRSAARASRPTCAARTGSASSTRLPSTAAHGRSTPRRWRRSRTSTPRCRACTSVGRRGASSRCGRCCADGGAGSPWLLYPIATLFCIVVTGNHYWIDGLGGLLALGIGIVVGFGLHRWNTDRLDRRASGTADRL